MISMAYEHFHSAVSIRFSTRPLSSTRLYFLDDKNSGLFGHHKAPDKDLSSLRPLTFELGNFPQLDECKIFQMDFHRAGVCDLESQSTIKESLS